MADITPLTVFSSAGERNTDGLTQANGFPASQKPKRQWFNWLFNSLTAKINELVSKVNTLDGAVQPDAAESVKGIVRLATEAETSAGTSESLATHPKGVRDLVDAYRLTGDLGTTATLDVPIRRRDTGNASQIQVKYGTVTGASGDIVSYLDGAFDNATRLIVVSQRGASGAVYACSADNETVSGFTLRHTGGAATITVAYIAIGY